MSWKLIINVSIGLFLLLGVFWNYRSIPKTAFISTYEVFEGFDGKKELQQKLDAETTHKKMVLDSMQARIKAVQASKEQNATDIQASIIQYKSLEEQFQIDYQKQYNEYTESINKQINEYTKQYAEERGYDYIFGAAGNGSLMYGSSRFDVTKDLIKFINEKYAGK